MTKLRLNLAILLACIFVTWCLAAQQPQTQTAPNFAVNSAYLNGFGGGGYALTAGSGLTLNIGGGTANCEGTIVSYSAGTLTMSASTTNYIYLNAGSSCAPAKSTSSSVFDPPNVPLATVVTSGSAISSIADARTFAQAIAASGTTTTIAYGTASLGTSSIASGACASAVTVSATGVATTDNIQADFNADPTSTTGYEPSSSGMLTIIKYPTSNDVNFKVCNNTANSITPDSITLNWRVVR